LSTLRTNEAPEFIEEPVFREPWEAHAFAIVLQLHEHGLFSWSEWTSMLATRIAAARIDGEDDKGDAYYRYWMSALEEIISVKGASSPEELARYRHAWAHAAGRTPHGLPILLQPLDFDETAG
jgi:nitrile hydratase accessory protein